MPWVKEFERRLRKKAREFLKGGWGHEKGEGY